MYWIILCILVAIYLVLWLITAGISVKTALLLQKKKKEKHEYDLAWKFNMGMSIASWLTVGLIICAVVAVIVGIVSSGGAAMEFLMQFAKKTWIWMIALAAVLVCNIISGAMGAATAYKLKSFKNEDVISTAWKLSLISMGINLASVLILVFVAIIYFVILYSKSKSDTDETLDIDIEHEDIYEQQPEKKPVPKHTQLLNKLLQK